MKTITTTSMTQIARVRPAYPQAADRNLAADPSLAFGARGGSGISMYTSATSNAPAAKDVSYLRSRRPPV